MTEPQTLSVLIVDDVEDIRDLLRITLERTRRFTVVAEAPNGAVGVVQARTHQPAIVVLDVEMPVMDGLRALPLIRLASPHSTIVFFTALHMHHLSATHEAPTPDGHIRKGSSMLRVPAHLERLHLRKLQGGAPRA